MFLNLCYVVRSYTLYATHCKEQNKFYCDFFKTGYLLFYFLNSQKAPITPIIFHMNNLTFMSNVEFFSLLMMAFVISVIPLIRRPFLWAETFFHEISHGLAAIITGGKIKDFKINFNGSGYCTTLGGWLIPISFAGYLGASIWGALIFLAAKSNALQLELPLSELIAGFIILCHLFWAKGFSSYITGTFICLALLLPTQILPEYTNYLLALFGLHICINAIKAPFELWHSQEKGDASQLARATLIPSYIWILVWGTCSSYTIFWLWQQST